jgi:hypothetical protein
MGRKAQGHTMSIIWDIWNTVHGIIMSSDWITLGMAAVVLIGAGLIMEGIDSLVTTTLLALLAFALLGYVRAVTLGGQKAADYATADWHNFLDLHMMTLLAYALTFAVGIAVVHLARQLVLR